MMFDTSINKKKIIYRRKKM